MAGFFAIIIACLSLAFGAGAVIHHLIGDSSAAWVTITLISVLVLSVTAGMSLHEPGVVAFLMAALGAIETGVAAGWTFTHYNLWGLTFPYTVIGGTIIGVVITVIFGMAAFKGLEDL